MLNQLTKLATEKSSEKRFELMNAIAKMFVLNSTSKTQNELELFGDVFTKLLKDMDEDGKISISAQFAHLDNTPKTFAIALIYENADIAAPMLEYSNVLNDDDLINACNLSSTAHRVSIAKRNNVSMAVTDTLIGHGETDVLRTVSRNESANISANGFAHMVKNSPDDGELLAILLMREDLPDNVKKILPHLQGGVLKRVAKVADLHGAKKLTELMTETHETREAAQKAEALDVVSELKEVNQVRAEEISISEAVGVFAGALNIDHLVQLIAELEHIDASYVMSIMRHADGKEITALCRAIGLNKMAFKQVCHMRESILSLPMMAKTKMIEKFKYLPIEDAKATLRSAKLDHNIEQNLQ